MPIAPALCCKSCISDKVIPVDTCFDLNYCSGHGVCNLGACECAEGYGGADCKHRVSCPASAMVPTGQSNLGNSTHSRARLAENQMVPSA